MQPKPCRWILDITWLNLVELSKLSPFEDLLQQVGTNVPLQNRACGTLVGAACLILWFALGA